MFKLSTSKSAGVAQPPGAALARPTLKYVASNRYHSTSHLIGLLDHEASAEGLTDTRERQGTSSILNSWHLPLSFHPQTVVS